MHDCLCDPPLYRSSSGQNVHLMSYLVLPQPYPMELELCHVCGRKYVPDILLATCALPPSVGFLSPCLSCGVIPVACSRLCAASVDPYCPTPCHVSDVVIETTGRVTFCGGFVKIWVLISCRRMPRYPFEGPARFWKPECVVESANILERVAPWRSPQSSHSWSLM